MERVGVDSERRRRRRLDGELDSRSRAAEGAMVGGSQPGEIHRRGDVLVDVEMLCIAIKEIS